LEKADIWNMLEILNFGKSLEINARVKVLLNCVHGGTLWLDPPVSIDIAMIACITRLPKANEDLAILFNKTEERSLSELMKENFQTFRGKRGLDVKNINDINVRFAM
jgi:hypothetical protein